MNKPNTILLPAVIAALFSVYPVFPAAFTSGPTVTRNSSGATVAFEVNESIDAEVSVLNSAGAVVRHLAAGVLGGSFAPPEPLRLGLSQSIYWDGRDDYGMDTLTPPFKFRVRLGVHPVFERSLTTQVGFTGARTWGTGNVNPLESYLNLSHPMFKSDSSLYERLTLLDITVDDATDPGPKLGRTEHPGTPPPMPSPSSRMANS